MQQGGAACFHGTLARGSGTPVVNSDSYNDVLGDARHEKIKRDIKNIKCRGRNTEVGFLYAADVVIHTQHTCICKRYRTSPRVAAKSHT